MRVTDVLDSWGKILRGHTPLLSIEITRECPLRCPGCYAYGDDHLGGSVTLRELNDKRGDDLVEGVLGLVDRHQPLQVTLVGGEPMVRHRELRRILPELSRRGVWSMVVTSAIIPIPPEWMSLPNVTITVSVDGLPEHHDVRRHPATYERILGNIKDCRVNIHWTITAAMLQRSGYLEEYVRFWSERPEVADIWVSLYSPQMGEQSAEMLSREQREYVTGELPLLRARYPKLLTPEGFTEALRHPPTSPKDCTFSRVSRNYSADLKAQVEPCVFGGTPDCSQCGCSASAGMHAVREHRLLGPLKAKHFMLPSMAIGSAMARLKNGSRTSWKEREQASLHKDQETEQELVRISLH